MLVLLALRSADFPRGDGFARDGALIATPHEALEPLLLRFHVTDRVSVALDRFHIEQTLRLTVLERGRQRARLLEVDRRDDIFVGHVEDGRNAAQRIEAIEFAVVEIAQHLRALDLVEMDAVLPRDDPGVGQHAAAGEGAVFHQELHLIGGELVAHLVPKHGLAIEPGNRIELREDHRIARGLHVAAVHLHVVPGQHVTDGSSVARRTIDGGGVAGNDGGAVGGIPGRDARRIGGIPGQAGNDSCRVADDGRRITHGIRRVRGVVFIVGLLYDRMEDGVDQGVDGSAGGAERLLGGDEGIDGTGCHQRVETGQGGK